MDKQLVGELPDITESSNDDEIMVITDSQHNQLRKEKISNFIKDLVSNDENNGIKLGTDNKLLSVDASNADNITSGILNPERLPNSGVTEDTYVYPDSITVDKKGRVTKITNGTPGGNNADKDLSNITEAGKDVIRNTAGSGFSLFDVVEKDHILSFEESMGFGLLGTYVYKEPVAGSRYGYPDFYNECVAQKEAGTEETITVGDVSFTATKNPNGHIFYDIADKATVDEIFSQRGEAWFYGVDTENERVFLPRGTRSQYTVNTDETGDYVEAGLPNITGTMTADISEGVATGALKIDTIYSGAMWSGSTNVARMRNWSLDASLSNPVYGKSDTVQPYATKKLLYIVVGNVKVQSAASDVVDVTTTENDTVPLFTGQYFDFKPNNVSWVKANTTPSGNVYLSTYNELVNCLVEANNKYGLKVVDVADMIAGVDYSLYWKVNQTDMTFTTPSAILTKSLDGAVVGNGMTLGLTDGTNNVGLGNNYSSSLQTNWAWLSGDIYGTSQGTAHTAWTGGSGNSYGVTTDATKSGIIAQESTAQLYFKVANAVENLEILNVGQVMEELSNKVNVSNTSWATSACMPDYSAGVSITFPFTAQTAGIIQIAALNGYNNVNVNGNQNFNGILCAAPSNWNGSVFPVDKGDVITQASVTGTAAQTFYPLKGAIID